MKRWVVAYERVHSTRKIVYTGIRSFHDTESRNQDQRPGKPNPKNRNPGLLTQQSTRPLARGVFPAKMAILDLKTLKEKDSKEVVQKLNEGMAQLKFFLRSKEEQHNRDEFIYDLTCTLAKACRAPSGENTNTILAALKGSVFLSKKIPSLLDRVQASMPLNDQVSRQRLIQCLIEVFTKYLTHLPSSYVDLPYTQLKVALEQSSIDRKEELQKELDALKQARDGIIRGERQKYGKHYNYRVGEKPPNDFRDIPICPRNKEITTEERPFLRKNISKGRYENAEHYLDVQFRLLREDFLEPLREGIHEIAQNVPRQQRRQIMMKNFRNVRIISKAFTWSGIIHQVQIDVSRLDTSRWAHSKRLLYGSFLCLSKDNFKTVLFATVSKRDPEQLKEGKIDIRFIEEQDVLGIENRNYVYQMVESPAYFEAYRHVLKGLKELDETTLPFKKYLVECSEEVDPPEYLRRDDTDELVCYDLSKALNLPNISTAKAVPVLQPGAWPSVETLSLNRSQLEALRTAITTEFSVIQGPPGTGKTYVGAKIVKCLLDNRRAWDPDGISPMLMVCYTNHALDHFLEKVLEFLSEEEVIRVGGRCKSRILEACNLKHFTDEYRLPGKRREVRDKMHQNQSEMKEWKKHLTKADSELLEFNDLEELLNPEHADQLYNAVFPPNVENVCQTPGNTLKLWLCDNELLRSCNQSTKAKTEDPTRRNPNGSFLQDSAANEVFYDPASFTEPRDDEQNNAHDPLACATRDASPAENSLHSCDLLASSFATSSGRVNERNINRPDDSNSEREDRGKTVYEESDADEETIAIEREADMIQHQRRIQGEEELLNVISEEKNDFVSQKQDQAESNDENDDGWITVTYRKKGDSFFWRQTGSESSKEKSTGVHSPANEDKMAETISSKKKKNKNSKKKPNNVKIILSGDITHIKLNKKTMMSTEEAMSVDNIWNLSQSDRIRLYLFWIESYRERYTVEIHRSEQEYIQLCEELEAVRFEEEERVIRQATVVGMTTSGAARYHSVLQRIAPKIVVIEEAAEVMESHIITSLSYNTKHTILIGDHKQLRPKATVYELAQKYNLEVSLFERMVMNSMDCKRLSIQHRMRPEIAALTKRIYDHEIVDHESVCHFQDISGLCHNLFFIDHCQPENLIGGLQSYSNHHEADFLVALCKYLQHQGYDRKQITILTMYTGQLLLLQEKMPRREFQGMKVCVVDNFQGEENDIILLSLVRSNPEGCIGFLAEANRICVALSRARKGFYCIGNFSLLNRQCELWKEICDDLRTKKAIGDSLQLVCKRHNNVTSVRNAREFNKLGGCNMPCGERLPCGHACEIQCHTSSHSKMSCSKTCFNRCSNDHQCEWKCHFPQNCPQCLQKIPKTVPKCGHEQLVPCSQNPAKFSCGVKCEKVLPCGHSCGNDCGQLCTKQCQVNCIKTLPCGHEKKLTCYKDPIIHKQCDSNCTKVLECGHRCSKKCTQKCQCNTKIEVTLPCEHRVRILCRAKDSPIKCDEMCARVLDCGHDCSGTCHENCKLKKCETVVFKELPCGHQKGVSCFQNPKTAFCSAPCTRQLDCGHKCSSVCGRLCHEVRCEELCQKKCNRDHPCQKRCHFGAPCNDCKEEVTMTIPTCGHSINMPCHLDPASIKCKQPCERVRICGHPCKDICSKKCDARPCKVLVSKPLSCNHMVTLACHKNPEKFICKKEVEVQLSCGHNTLLECHVKKAGLEFVLCKENVEKELRCNHKLKIPCFKNPEDCICRKKVDVQLQCGHTKSVKCSTVAAGLSNVCCTVKVSRTLTCNHEITLPCYLKPEEYCCQEEVEIILACGHNKLTTCSSKRNELEGGMCDIQVTRKLPCGHEKEVQCSDKPDEIFCDAPCKRFLPCKHRCPNKCGDDCAGFKCVVEVKKDLTCGYHKVSCLCSEDVSQQTCSNQCTRKLMCGHQCPGRCSEVCSQYKCKRLVVKYLNCAGNHSVKMHCKDDPDSVACQERCNQSLECGHPCPGLCSQPCARMKCKRGVEKKYLRCGHKEQLQCFQSKTAICKAPCQRRERCKHMCKGICGEPCSKYPCNVVLGKALPCGHKVKMPCSFSVDDVQCPASCETRLPCGHPCSGTCTDCKQRGSHEMCQRPCGRLLVCLHRCQAKCSEPCPPCNKKCGRRCPHAKCTLLCLKSCGPCRQPCKWSCPHYQCNNLCGEECDRPRCDAPCPKKLACRHPCIGLCGENCPTVCATCHTKKLSSVPGKTTETTRYLQLFDCGHIVTVEEMDAWMLRAMGSDVQLIQCPRCSKAITFSFRYGNFIKGTLKNFENVKAQIYDLANKTAKFSSGLVDDLRHFRDNLRKMKFSKYISLTFTLKNHLLIMDQVKKVQLSLKNMEKHQESSKEPLDIKKHSSTIKDALEKITEYLERPQLDLTTLNQVHEHTRKFALFASILEAQCEAIKRHKSLSSSGVLHLKLAKERFDLFAQGNNDALQIDWLETIVASLRREVDLTPLPPEKPKDFENFPGFNRGVWKLCEHRQVYFTISIVRDGEDVSQVRNRCRQCLDIEQEQ